MSLSVRAVLLLFVMVWQALSCASIPSVAQPQVPLSHVWTHAERVDHHHHQDATLHFALDANDTFQPHHIHDHAPTASLIGLCADWILASPEATLNAHLHGLWSSVSLDGWLRPPNVA